MKKLLQIELFLLKNLVIYEQPNYSSNKIVKLNKHQQLIIQKNTDGN